jgi:IS1 family transposase
MANILHTDKKIMAVSMLCEGSSIRSVERITGVHRDTIMRLGVRVGQGCKKILDEKMRDLTCKNIQVDEIWGFIGAKQKTVHENNLDSNNGNIWTWIALDSDTKIVPTFAIGDRTKEMAHKFMHDLAFRTKNRIQISSDALPAYVDAIEEAFGSSVDYGTVIKKYSHSDLYSPATRYSPPDVLQTKKVKVQGNPKHENISTSFIEKQNHTLRMHCRRLSRLTNAFSKKRENFEAAVALHFAYYNFVKAHVTLKCSPAMAAGISSSFWKVGDLIEITGG